MNERNQPGRESSQPKQASCPPGSTIGSQATSGAEPTKASAGSSMPSATSTGTFGGTPPTTGTTGSTTSGAGSTATGNIATGMSSASEETGTSPSLTGSTGTAMIEESGESERSTTEEFKHKAGEAGRQLREQAAATGQHLKQQAGEAADEMMKRGRTMASERKEHVANQISGVSAAIRDAAHRLHDEDDHNIARYTEALADQVDRVSGYLRNRDLSGLFHDVENVARKRPEVFLGGMFVTGLAIARFLKASHRQPRRADTFDRDFESEHRGMEMRDEWRSDREEDWAAHRPLETASTGSLTGGSFAPGSTGSVGSGTSTGLAGASVTSAGYGASATPDIPEPRSQPSFENKPR